MCYLQIITHFSGHKILKLFQITLIKYPQDAVGVYLIDIRVMNYTNNNL